MATDESGMLREVSERLLSCDICKEDFNSRDRRPRILPCSHSFCERCLSSLGVRGYVKCPICRGNHPMKQSFPVDTTRITLLDLLASSKKKRSSSGQGEGKCQQHQRALELFCRTCQLPICSSCLLHLHKTHDGVVELETVALEKRKQVQSLCQELVEVIPIYQEKAKSCEAHLETLREEVKLSEGKLKSLFHQAVTHLQEKEAKALMVLQQQSAEDISKLESQLATFRSLQSASETTCRYGKKERVTATQAFASLTKDLEMEKAAKELRRQKSTPVRLPPKYGIDEKDKAVMEDLVRQIQTIECSAFRLAKQVQSQSLTYPAFHLDAERCGRGCSVGPGGITLRNEPSPAPAPPPQQPVFQFPMTCGTAPLCCRQSCYWQVTCSASPRPRILEEGVLCQLGVATRAVLEGYLRGQGDICLVAITLSLIKGDVAASCWFQGKLLAQVALARYPNPDSTVTRTLGFLLDAAKSKVSFIDVGSGQVLCQCPLDLTQQLWPAFYVGTPAENGANVCVTLESGLPMDLSSTMFNLLDVLLKPQ